ncbi:RNA polymerase sigma factor [Anaerobacillus sp. HL2]|nr:RNA polymerase sigma factor [Anaerobacillus sp. HL2]
MREIKKGNRQAFRKLYDQYFDYAIRVATAVTHNHSTAADVVQETFIRIYKNIDDKYDEEKPFQPWFYRILINECNRYLKKFSKIIPMDVNEDIHLPPENDRYQFEDYEDLYVAIQKLEDYHKIPIILKYLNDLTDQDIANALELNINTVKSRLLKESRDLKIC